jgi:hypothetical protein
MTQLIAVKGIEYVDPADLNALIESAKRISIDPNWLASVIAFETGGTWSPSIKNAVGSGATGLIQFMPSTAKQLGTTVSDLAVMSFKDQLKYVEAYFGWFSGLHNLEDVYLAVFYPKAIGQSNSWVVANQGEAVYTQNSGFDSSQKGYITRGDITSTIRGVYNAGVKRGVVEVPLAVYPSSELYFSEALESTVG